MSESKGYFDILINQMCNCIDLNIWFFVLLVGEILLLYQRSLITDISWLFLSPPSIQSLACSQIIFFLRYDRIYWQGLTQIISI